LTIRGVVFLYKAGDADAERRLTQVECGDLPIRRNGDAKIEITKFAWS